MRTTLTITFTDGYDLERKIEDFLAQRSSELASGGPSGRPRLQVDFIGVEARDPRTSAIRAAAGPLGLQLQFS